MKEIVAQSRTSKARFFEEHEIQISFVPRGRQVETVIVQVAPLSDSRDIQCPAYFLGAPGT
jgi:hypothetical protein